MATVSTKLIALATALIKKGDDQKAIERVEKAVKTNANVWRNELFAYEMAVSAAKERVEALSVDTSATMADCLSASRNLALAEKNFADGEALSAARF